MRLPDMILLNGTSIAGKSSLQSALQDRLPAPYIRMGIDDFVFERSPVRWFGAEEGLRFERRNDGLVDVVYGAEVMRLQRAYHRSVRICVEQGLRVVVDEVILTRELLDDWVEVLSSLDVFFIGMRCDAEEIVLRENTRRDRTRGTALAQMDLVHAHGLYDLELDSTLLPTSALARQVLEALQRRVSPSAFEQLAQAR
jgi:chloramphenicol 3-O phosphotransferase